MSSLVIPELGTAQTGEWDKILLQYIFDKWTETDPAKGTDLIDPLNKEKLRFRVGLPDTLQPYEISLLQMRVTPTQQYNGGQRLGLMTEMEIVARMKRLDRDKPDLQLLKMELELMRIAMAYNVTFPRGITGIKSFVWGGMDRQYSPVDTWSKSEWRSIIRIGLVWEIQLV